MLRLGKGQLVSDMTSRLNYLTAALGPREIRIPPPPPSSIDQFFKRNSCFIIPEAALKVVKESLA